MSTNGMKNIPQEEQREKCVEIMSDEDLYGSLASNENEIDIT